MRGWRLSVAAVVVWGAVVGGGPLLLGPPGGDDAYYHAMYAVEHARCLRGGVWWPHWYPDLLEGLGAPEPRARPVLPMAAHGAVALLLDDAVATNSLVTVLIPVAAGLVALLVARRRGASTATAIAAGVAWATLPYLVVTLHQRVALQEAWAVALLPWTLDSLLPPRPHHRADVIRGALAFAVLASVQLLVAFMAGVTVAVAHLLSPSRRTLRAAAAGALGMALAAVSWLPNAIALGRVQGAVFTGGWFDWRERFLLASGGPDPGLSRRLAWAMAGVAAAAIVAAAAERSGRRLGFGALALCVLATPLAWPLYAAVPGFDLLQFPWRWVAVGSTLALFAAVAGQGRARAASLALLVIPVMTLDPFAWRLPAGEALRPSESREQITAAATRFGVPPVLPPFPAMIPQGVDLATALPAGRAARESLAAPTKDGPGLWQWTVESSRAAEVSLPLLAADGWRATLDSRPLHWEPRDGLVGIAVPAGEHVVRLEQAALPEDVAGTVVSLAAGLGLVGFWWSRRRARSPSPEAPGG